MKTIFINGRFLCQKLTGVQRFAIELLKEIDIQMNPNELSICLIVPEEQYVLNKIQFKNITIQYIKGKPGYKWEQITLARYCKKHKPNDLLNLCNNGPILYPGSCVLHDTAVEDTPKSYSFKYRFIHKLINRWNMKRYKNVFTVSNTMKSRIEKIYKPKKVIPVYNGHEHILNVLEQKPEKEFPDKFYFALGSMNPNKNFKAILHLATQNPTLQFVISGSNNSKVFKDKEDKYPENVHFLGYLTDENIKYLYSHCEAFLFPSTYEGFGIPPLEAIACGCKHVICNDIPVLKEVYAGYCNVESFEDLDLEKIEYVSITDEALKKYSWKISANKVLEIIS